MGIYVITGGSSGIGAQAVRILRERGEIVCNLDIVGGDLSVNLCDPASRRQAVTELHRRYPDGIDGLICNAGVIVGPRITAADVISINYFGAVELAEQCFDLLEKRHGHCVVTASGALTFYQRGGPCDINDLLNNDGDELRIRSLVDTFDPAVAGQQMYIVSKYALTRWMRRTAPGWGRKGVSLNAVAPGVCETKITADMPPEAYEFVVLGNPMPVYYEAKAFENPGDLASTMVFLASPASVGICGQMIYCDGGTDDVLYTETFLGTH